MFFKELVHVYKTHEKKSPGSHYFSFLHWAINLHKPVYIFAWQGNSSSEHAKCAFTLYYYIRLPLCAHILYFDSAISSFFDWYILLFLLSDNGMNMK